MPTKKQKAEYEKHLRVSALKDWERKSALIRYCLEIKQ